MSLPEPLAPSGLFESAVRSLRSLARIVEAFDDARYAVSPLSGVTGGAGPHVRHCLAHFDALLFGLTSGTIDYDTRLRGGAEETDRQAALARIAETEDALACAVARWDSGITVSVIVLSHCGRQRIAVASSFARELAFVVSHATHHEAVVAILARLLGVRVAADHGVAPSTALWREETKSCAR